MKRQYIRPLNSDYASLLGLNKNIINGKLDTPKYIHTSTCPVIFEKQAESSFGTHLEHVFGENLPWNGILECSWNALSENSSRTQFWITILERSWNTLLGGNVAVERNFGTRGKVAHLERTFGGKVVLERSWNTFLVENLFGNTVLGRTVFL